MTATLQSSGFLEDWRSRVKDFLCFETHENFSSPLDIDNAWDMLALQLGMFWVGMDICPHSCLIKGKKSKKENDFNMIILHCYIPQLFHHWTQQCSHIEYTWGSADTM